uniref:Lipoprotein n=1 Tax=Roseihalotalea indica TaxID=2867963 RepID=A0AA49GIW0_9BACT|nr:hypothetical protein K4G66_21860 [Tunicatimonas sp. TK19036]
MKQFLISSSLSLLIAASFSSCEDEGECACVEPMPEYTYTFESGKEGWTTGFADYPVGEDEFYELGAEVAALPSPLDANQKGIKITGNNHSDDLFMFLTRPITNLGINATYQLVVEIEMAYNVPENSVGIGGSSVYLKAGAATKEPKAVQQDDFWQMNLDKGNQSQPGADMQVLGTIGTDREDFTYTLISADNRDNPMTVKTDDQGKLWVIIGTDSAFEGITTLYYNRITVRLLP